jgi:hypothetical protein
MVDQPSTWLERETALARRSRESQTSRRGVVSERPWEIRSSQFGDRGRREVDTRDTGDDRSTRRATSG